MIEVLRFASAYLDIPSTDVADGIVRARTASQHEWLSIASSSVRPRNAWLRIERDATWYWNAADDLTSRIGFTLLNSLFSSIVGEVPGAKPLLTLPVK